MALQGVLRSMPEYATHIRAGVVIPREGREFVVVDDEKDFAEPAKAAKAIFDEATKSGAIGFESGDRPVVYHVAESNAFTGKMQAAEKRGRLVDIPGKPLVMDALAYEYFRQAFGVNLSCEPIGGLPDPMASQARMAAQAEEIARLRARIAELEKQPAKK